MPSCASSYLSHMEYGEEELGGEGEGEMKPPEI